MRQTNLQTPECATECAEDRTVEELRAENAQLRERALAAEKRNIGLIHEADNAKRGEATYKRWYEERKAKHLQADADACLLWQALEWITDCWGKDEDDYCRADMQGAIEAGREALASTPRTAQVAAVVKAAIEWHESRKEYFGPSRRMEKSGKRFDAAMDALESAVDALRATEEGETRQRDASAG